LARFVDLDARGLEHRDAALVEAVGDEKL